MRRQWFAWIVAASLAGCGSEAPSSAPEAQELDGAYLHFSTQDNDFRLACFHVASVIEAGFATRRDFCLHRLQRAEESALALRARAYELAVASDFDAETLAAPLDGYVEALGVLSARILRGELRFDDENAEERRSATRAVSAVWEESLVRYAVLLDAVAEQRNRVHRAFRR